MPPAQTWPWMPAPDNGLNPGPTPQPPNRGLNVQLSTGPSGRSNWFGARDCADQISRSTSYALAVRVAFPYRTNNANA